MEFDQLPEFDKDLKCLLKKYRTLNDDLRVVKQVLEIFPDERSPFSFRIDNLGLSTCVIKVKKIACKSRTWCKLGLKVSLCLFLR
jgi:hypothetical protein